MNNPQSRVELEPLADALVEVCRSENVSEVTVEVIPLDQLDLESLSSSLAGLTDPIGQLKKWLEELLKTIAKKIQEGLKKVFEELLKPVKEIIDKIFGGVKDVIDFIKRIAKGIAEIISKIGEGLPKIIEGIAELGGKLVEFVTEIIDKIVEVGKNLGQLLYKVFEAVGEIASNVVKGISELLKSLGEKISEWIKSVIESVKKIGEKIGGIVSSIIEGVGKVVKGIVDFIKSAIEGVMEGLKKLGELFGKAIEGAVKTISEVIGKVVSAVKKFIEGVLEAIGKLGKALADIGGKIIEAISGIVKAITEFISKAIKGVIEAITNVLKAIGEAVGKIVEAVAKVIKDVADFIGKAIKGVVEAIGKVFKAIGEAVGKIIETIGNIIKGVADFIGKAIKGVIEAIKGIFKAIGEAIGKIVGAIGNIIKGVIDFIGKAIRGVVEAIGKVFKTLAEIGAKILGAIANVIKGIVDFIGKAIRGVIETIRKVIDGVIKAIAGGLKTVIEAFSNIAKTVINAIWKGIEGLVSLIKQGIRGVIEAIGKVIEGVGKVIANVVNAVRKGFETLMEALKTLIKPVQDAIAGIGKAIAGIPNLIQQVIDFIRTHVIDPILKGIGNIVNMVGKGFELITRTFTGFVNAIMNFPTWFEKHLVQPLLKGLGEFFKPVIDFFKPLWEGIQNFIDFIVKLFTKPEEIVETLKDLWERLCEGLKWFAETILNIISGIIKGIQGVVSKAVSGLIGAFTGLASAILQAVSQAINRIIEAFTKKASPSLLDIIVTPIFSLYRLSTKYYEDSIKEIVKIKPSKLLESPLVWVYQIGGGIIAGLFIVEAIRSIYKAVANATPPLDVYVQPLGIGAKIKLRLGRVIKAILDTIGKAMPDVLRYLMIGHMIWWAEPTRALTRLFLTEQLTVELPPLEHTLSTVRRHIPTPYTQDYYDIFQTQLRMGGIYKGFIESLYPLPEELLKDWKAKMPKPDEVFDATKFSVVIKDRFGVSRLLPVTLIASLPTPSELSRMMIRDIILEPRYFKTAMTMHGFHPDIAFMYYLLHFRYPSPEKLWEFVARGIAGLLWYEATDADVKEASTLIKEFGLEEGKFMPVSPTALNFKGKALLNALTKYMKWHDYLPFSWLKPEDIGAQTPFTSDNMLVKDVVVDIPTKIDVRWMTKWGIFDHIAKRVDVTKAPAKEFLKILEDRAESPEISMDLVLKCRLLQATGLHPYYVPITAVAEAINALSEERTLLRTGFINLYKEGFFDYKTLDRLLAGFFTASFRVAYYDFESEQWIPKWINIPVKFLPAEARLLELRAVFDRALDILRDYMRMLSRGVMYLIYSIKQAREKLKNYINLMSNKWFKEEVKKITGKELRLTLDEAWSELYFKYFEELADMETIVRARYYARYMIASIIRRFERGYLTEEEAEKLLDKIIEELRESKVFKELIKTVGKSLHEAYVRDLKADAILARLKRRKITKEEALNKLIELGLDRDVAEALVEAKATPYSISLTTMATLLEIVPEALNYALKSLELFGFNPEEYEYWLKYVARRPFRDELTLIRTRIYRVLERGVEPERLVEILKEYMVKPVVKDATVKFSYGETAKALVEFYNRHRGVFEAYGISAEEWVLYNLIARLEREEEVVKEYIPTPTMLATMREYIMIPDKLIEEVFEKRGVPEEWRQIWRDYIKVRPLANDVRGLMSAYRRAKVLNVITEEVEKKVLKLAKLVGFTDEELEILKLRIEIEELIRNAREYIPTPMMLATLSEYIKLPEEYIDEALKLRRVPERWLKFWKQYIKVRPLADDVRRLLTAYRRAKVLNVLTPELEEKVKELARMVGFTHEELAIIDLRVELERLVRGARIYIPTPSMLATMSEYIKISEELIDKALEFRRVPEEWVPIWKNYIKIRPLADDVRRLLTAYRRAKVLGVVPADLENQVKKIAEKVGWTDEEFKILDLRIKLEELVRSARAYVPTPTMLATMSEYLPEARKFIEDVLRRRNVAREYWSLWAKYVTVRPLANEVRRLLRNVERLYAYFYIKPEDYKKFLNVLKPFGYEDKELELIMKASDFARMYQGFRSLIGTIRGLVSMAEYSPRARKIALGQVKKMIDALPVDPETKEFLKAMWEEFIKVRPVYNEVRRYVTELISDYAEGVIDQQTLKKELEELKEWGLDDMEIEFYMKLAEKRRWRYELRQLRRMRM